MLAHIYHSHYDKVVIMNEDPHLNTLFAHFVSFALEFKLLDEKELTPMRDLIDELTRTGVIPSPSATSASSGGAAASAGAASTASA